MRLSPRVLAVALLLVAPAGLRAQSPASVSDLAQLLALEDRREFDGGTLRRAAQHPDALVRTWCARAVGRIGDRAGTSILLDLLSDPDTTVRAEAAFALGQLRDTTAVPELVRRMEALDAVTTDPAALEIVTALAKIGGSDAAQAFEALLRAHPPTLASADEATPQALLEVWRLGRLAPAQRLVAYVRDGQGLWRRNAVYSAARLRLGGAAAGLLDATGDGDALTRQWAARALTAELADSARIARGAFAARLRQLAGDADPQVRVNALRALASFRDSTQVGAAAPHLQDQDPNVAVQAASTLGALGGSRAVSLLGERVAQQGTFALRRAALEGLASASPAAAIAAGQPWKADADWRMRAAYAGMLGIAATPEARTDLVALTGDADGRVAAAALTALRQVVPAGDSALRSLARARLADQDVMVRAAALEILARERDPALLPDLVAAYRAAAREPMNDARLAAVQAIGDVAEASAEDRQRVEGEFLAAVGRSDDYLVRRAVAERFGAESLARRWGAVGPVTTGRSAQDYQSLIRRYVLPPSGTPAPTATIETERGTMVVTLLGADAPITVDNFLRLVDRHYFDGSRWHRVVPNFVIQDGDPRGDGNGGPGTVIRDEINRWRYQRGMLGMALSGPDTGGSQFFLTHSPQPHLDGRYTIFGQLSSGGDVLDLIVQGDRIRRITR
jgi:cyclophilin family peptidyl-prolyl cis-trans isomerase/HEAT repeat protein